jgi:hypothetical protein
VSASRPPITYRGTPCRRVLAPGTQLFRLHRRTRPVTEFVPRDRLADPHFGGGRFDPTAEDAYPYLYAAFSSSTALAERLLRDFPFTEHDARILPRATLRERRLSSLAVTRPVQLVALTTAPELAAVSQDEWLVQAGPDDYGKTRRWAHWLRGKAPWAQGFVWPSKRDVGEEAVILFGDRCAAADFGPGLIPHVDLDSYDGGVWLRDALADYRVTFRLPPRPAASA